MTDAPAAPTTTAGRGYRRPNYERHELDGGDVLLKIENGDPRIEDVRVSLALGLGDDDDDDGGDDWDLYWERTGLAVRRSRFLKAMELRNLQQSHDEEGVRIFLDRAAQNRSIEHLIVAGCDFRLGYDFFYSLAPLFGHCTLRSVAIYGCVMPDSRYEAMASALSRCVALERLELQINESCLVRKIEEQLVSIFVSLNEHNTLLELKFFTQAWLGRTLVTALAMLLENPKSKLFHLDLGRNLLDDACIEILSRGLSANKSIKELKINCIRTGTDSPWNHFTMFGVVTKPGWDAMLNAIASESSIESLCMGGKYEGCFDIAKYKPSLTNEAMSSLGKALTSDGKLVSLDLTGTISVTTTGWQAFSSCLGEKCCLNELILNRCYVGGDGGGHLFGAMARNTSIKRLSMQELAGFNCACWTKCLRKMSESQVPLEEFDLSGNCLRPEAVEIVVGVLERIGLIQVFDLRNDNHIATAGFKFARILRQQGCRLKKLSFQCHFQDRDSDEHVIEFANALVDNKSLQELKITGCTFTSRGWGAFARALCDSSTLDSTFSSNHVLREMSMRNIPENVAALLQLNACQDKAAVARRKILMHHFSDIDAAKRQFTIMDKVLPHAVEWIGRSDDGLSLMNALLHEKPYLCGLRNVTPIAGRKRKFELQSGG